VWDEGFADLAGTAQRLSQYRYPVERDRAYAREQL
jgi:hypothetical protein